MKEKAVKTELIADCPTGKPNCFLRIERRHWADGTSCLHIAKYGYVNGKLRAWWPPQYVQVDWELNRLLGSLVAGNTPVIPCRKNENGEWEPIFTVEELHMNAAQFRKEMGR
jgi:hypothetical protein